MGSKVILSDNIEMKQLFLLWTWRKIVGLMDI